MDTTITYTSPWDIELECRRLEAELEKVKAERDALRALITRSSQRDVTDEYWIIAIYDPLKIGAIEAFDAALRGEGE